MHVLMGLHDRRVRSHKKPAQHLGPGDEKSCRRSSSVGKSGINDKLLEISAVS